MTTSFIARKTVTIEASPSRVWEALTTPAIVKQYMFGADVISDWRKGSALIYKGQWEGTPYEDKGIILDIRPDELLKATYYSALSGLPDVPDSYNTITYGLAAVADGKTELTVTQDNNSSPEAAAKAEANWGMVLGAIKDLLEN